MSNVSSVSNREILKDIVGIGTKGPISGPWKLSVYDSSRTSRDSGLVYIFIEEHHNEGSCPEERHFSQISAEILQRTTDVHVLVENFIHSNDLVHTRTGSNSLQQSCGPVESGILNNLRNCLEVMRLNTNYCPGGCDNRIHFIDPRVDMVSVLPDGKLFEAISHYAEHQAYEGDVSEAVLTVFEGLVHPLSSLLPDKKNLKGRLVGAFEMFRSKMTPDQVSTFDKVWLSDITGGITEMNDKYIRFQRKYTGSKKLKKREFSEDIEDIKACYKKFTNTFLDMWLLAHVFMIQNTGTCDGIVMYLGSLHGIQIEKYMKTHGFELLQKIENSTLDSCLNVTRNT